MAKKKSINTKKAEHREEHLSLTLSDRFFIEQHGDMSQEELANALNKPIDIIREYVLELAKKYQKTKKSRASSLMDRPGKRKGVLAMTEAASMVGDDAYSKYITLEAINRAMADGKDELVKELKKRYEEQERSNKETIRGKYSSMIHYIAQPDDDAEVY